MAMDDGRTIPALVLWTAKRVITQHSEPPCDYRAAGTCAQCRHEGCDMLTWAIGIVKAHRVTGNRTEHFVGRARPAPQGDARDPAAGAGGHPSG